MVTEAENERRKLMNGIDLMLQDGLINKCTVNEIAQINELLNKGRLRYNLERAKDNLNYAQKDYNHAHEEASIAGVL